MAVQLARYRISTDEYEQMIAAGVFAEDLRIELIDGEIIAMPPIGDGHVGVLNLLVDDLYAQTHGVVSISVQNPIRIPPYGEPQPDVALIRRIAMRRGVPGIDDILLVTEIADTSADYDRKIKLPMYAAAGIPEAWFIDIRSRVIERHAERLAGSYRQVASARRERSLTSTVLPELTIRASLIFD